MKICTLSLSLATIAFVGCSSGSHSDNVQYSVDSTPALLVDGSAGTGTTLQAVLNAVVLERRDGSLTRNLLRDATNVAIADGSGLVDTVPTHGVAPGIYVALHVVLADGVTGTDENGDSIDIAPASLDQRVAFDEPITSDGRATLALFHTDMLDIENGVWTPHWGARLSREHYVRMAVEVLRFDRDSLIGLGRRLRGERVFELDFSALQERNADDDGVGRVRATHREDVARVAVGRVIFVVGLLIDSTTLQVLRFDDGPSAIVRQDGDREMPRVLLNGPIAAIADDGSSFTMTARGRDIEVLVDEHTAIASGTGQRRHLVEFASLVVGDRLRVVGRRTDRGTVARLILVRP